MGTKQNPGPYDCYANALPDEPMFVLLGRDPCAPSLIEAWASAREQAIALGGRPKGDQAMVTEARRLAAEMRTWRLENDGAWRVPEVGLEHAFLRHLIDVVWGIAHEDQSVPATDWADRMIVKARQSFPMQYKG